MKTAQNMKVQVTTIQLTEDELALIAKLLFQHNKWLRTQSEVNAEYQDRLKSVIQKVLDAPIDSN